MISNRATQWSSIKVLHGKRNTYHPVDNPNGFIDFGNAENWLVHDFLIDFINKNARIDGQCLTYGEGYTGTERLRNAMAKHLNIWFQPVHDILAEDITFAAGVTDLNEACALVTCDPGEAIMLGAPVYGTFGTDLRMRTGAQLEHIYFGDVDQFTPECVAAYDAGFEVAKARGVKIKALVICNPHNPLGRCYPPETLKALLRFCNDKNIHLISDEIYALSTIELDDRPCETFTSIRAIDYSEIVDAGQVHILYGMSKDWGAAGFRLGCIISQNVKLASAIRATCRFSSPSQFSMLYATRLLEDQAFVKEFLNKSYAALRHNRLLAEKLLSESSITWSKPGNAGLFLWIDLSRFLPLDETNGDGWAAERLLQKRMIEAGFFLSSGELYKDPRPGQFRVVFSMKEYVLREGLHRLVALLEKKY